MLSAADLPEVDDPEAVATLGADLSSGARQIADTAEAVEGVWSPLTSAYDAPEGPTVWNAMGTPVAIATQLTHQVGTAADALGTYAADLRRFAARRAELVARIAESHHLWSIARSTPATLSAEQVAMNGGEVGLGINPEYMLAESRASSFESRVLGEMAEFAAELAAAQRTCANAIGAIHGAPHWVEAGSAHVDYEYVWGSDAGGVVDAVRTGANGWATPAGWHTLTGAAGNVLLGAWNDVTGAAQDIWALTGLGSDQGATHAARSGLMQFGGDLWHANPIPWMDKSERALQANERLSAMVRSTATGVLNDPGTALGTVVTGILGGAGAKAARIALAAPTSALAGTVRTINLPVFRLEMREIPVPALTPALAPALATTGGAGRVLDRPTVRAPIPVRDGHVTVGQIENHLMTMTGRGTTGPSANPPQSPYGPPLAPGQGQWMPVNEHMSERAARYQ